MSNDPNLLKLNNSLAREFSRIYSEFKKIPSGSSVLMEHNNKDLYIFVGTHLKAKSNEYRIALFSKEERTIQKLESKYNILPKFNNIKIYKGFIAISQKWYDGDILNIVQTQSVLEAETTILKKFNEEWENLLYEILKTL
ncbi:MAG: hypothetical protein IPM47_07025 [Sphingobacteriales bacterium]|nr:MAG: hypothetical protein IPM47_07025 [Sphingobacteriales bacterium]